MQALKLKILQMYPTWLRVQAGWKFTTAFASLKGSDLQAILSKGITDELAGKIAKLATGDAKYTLAVAEGAASVTQSPAEDGLYVAIITPGKAGVMYNPIFVGSDYYVTGNNSVSNTWTVTTNLSYSNSAMAKKTEITVEKTAKDQQSNDENYSETVRVGDTVDFTVVTTIPEFADNYTKAVFKVSDALSTGLKLDATSLKIYAGTGDSKTVIAATNYDAPTTSDSGFTVNFTTDYLLSLSAAQPITITYSAEVTNEAITSVNIEDNTVTVNFSNDPTDEIGKGTLKDETKHYTFDIDANLLGEATWKTIEVVKVGVDKDGHEITKETIREGQSYGALAGAEFELQLADGTRYSNKYYGASDVIVSDAAGRLTVKDADVPGIRGLDAGTYKLVETKAPDGYIKAQAPVTIVIDTKMKTVHHSDTINDILVEWDVEELASYTITIDGKTTANYTMTNEEKPSKGDIIIGSTDGGDDGKIKNVQGVELPSTGGIGTTIFYVVGGLLVVGAAVILVARRKADN